MWTFAQFYVGVHSFFEGGLVVVTFPLQVVPLVTEPS